MKRILSIAVLFLAGLSAWGQTLEDILARIERNNASLAASASEVELEQARNRQEYLLDDPNVEFNYLWGQNSAVGNRYDLSVSQSFDIATLTGMKGRQVRSMNELSHLRYKADRLNVLLEAKQLLLDLVFCNAMIEELTSHREDCESLCAATSRKVTLGEATAMEYNKARLHLASVKGKVAKVEVERNQILAKLQQLNGGEPISFTSSVYPSSGGQYVLPADFGSWYHDAADRNPVLRYVAQEIEVGQKQLRIDKMEWLPDLTVGYMSEIGLEDKYRGLTFGIAIPLWRNSSAVKKSMAQISASQARQKQVVDEFEYKLRMEYESAHGLKEVAEEYRDALEATDNRSMLLKAQSEGEISMIDYIVEVDLYYESLEECLAAERDYQKALAELNAVNL